MRFSKGYVVVFLMLLLMSGCHKESIPPQLIGDWFWEGTSGGFAGTSIKPEPGDRVVLQFTANGQFSVHQNDTLSCSGQFQLATERSIYSGKDEAKIVLKDIEWILSNQQRRSLVLGGVITLSASQLLIGENVYDGYSSAYVRN